MIGKKDIEKLVTLCRIEVSEEEKNILAKDMESILSYVSQIKGAVSTIPPKEVLGLYNVMREDKNPHEKGTYTKEIMNEAPDKENGYVKVKQIL